MTRDDSVFLIESQKTTLEYFKMTKSRTAMFLVVITLSCALIFSITEAYPTAQPETVEEPDLQLSNNSKLVITHVVKTIEFEVGIVDDDGVEDENATVADTSEFYETDIQLLNVDLLKEVVNKADEIEQEEEKEEMDKAKDEKTEPDSLVPLVPNVQSAAQEETNKQTTTTSS